MPTTFCTPAEFAATTITAAYGATDTTLQVSSVSALKGNSNYPFYATLQNRELVKVTGDTGGASPVTVVRGMDGTTAVSGIANDTLSQNANAQNIKDLNVAVNALETSAVLNIQPAETPTGTQDGLNAIFTLAHVPNGILFILSINGLIQKMGVGNDFTLSGAAITFSIAPGIKDIILVTYTY